MASVDWKKLKLAQDVKNVMFHDDKDKRLQSNHDNENIDKNLTKYNLQVYDYETACDRYDRRIEVLDHKEGANKRKDRVTALGLVTPIPDGIPDQQVGEFATRVNQIFKDMFGGQNMIACYVHVDEIHDYIDTTTKEERTSMRHMHNIVIPEQDGKLNAKAVCSKKNMVSLNNAIEEMCEKIYGVKFLTGEKTKSKDSVESLKLKSKALELERKERELEREAKYNIGREIELDDYATRLDEREAALDEREGDLEAYDRITHKKREEADMKLSEAVQREQAVTKREASVQQAENSITIQLASLRNRADELEERERKLTERERNFNAEVRKAAEKMLEREKTATATLEQFEKQRKQAERIANLPNFFGSNE